jgi:hypothetical protein
MHYSFGPKNNCTRNKCTSYEYIHTILMCNYLTRSWKGKELLKFKVLGLKIFYQFDYQKFEYTYFK